jgi:hypothetical protein
MKSLIARVLLVVFLIIIVVGAWSKPLDTVAAEQIDAGLKRSLISFATARGLNGVISVVQGTTMSATPLGVGLTVTPGQILHPLNELTSQFAELMLVASIAFGAMKVLIGIGSFWVISLVMSAFALCWAWYWWQHQCAPLWIEKILFVLIFVRFAMPLVTIGSDAAFRHFMQSDYTESQKVLDKNSGELEALAPTTDESKTVKTTVEQLKGLWSSINPVPKLRQVVSDTTKHIVTVIVVFLMQTLVIPLLLFWALYKGTGALIFSPGAWRSSFKSDNLTGKQSAGKT